MKKIAFLFFCALLACMAAGALAAEDFTMPPVQDEEGRQETFHSLAVGDEVYLLSSGMELYRLDLPSRTASPLALRNANPEYERVPEAVLKYNGIRDEAGTPEWMRKKALGIHKIFWRGHTLYGVNELHGTLYRLKIQGEEAVLHAFSKLDFSADPEKEPFPSIDSGAVCNGSLYLVMTLAAEDAESSAYRFDMATGVREPLQGQGTIKEIASFREGRLLLLETDGSQWQIIDFDTATQNRTPLYESAKVSLPARELSGLVYDPWRDRVLIQWEEKVLAFTGNTSYDVVAYLQPGMSWASRGILEDGRMLVALKHLYVRSVLEARPERKPVQIAYGGDLSGPVQLSYEEAYPDVVIRQRFVRYEEEAVGFFAEQMNLRSDEIAIFELPIGTATQNALEKGYYHALHASPAIREKVDRYRPFFQQAVKKGNDIAAVFLEVEQSTLAYSQFALAELGLTAEDMPSSYTQLLDFLLAWGAQVGEAAQQLEITPFDISNSQLKVELFTIFMNQYYALMEKNPSALGTYEAEMAALLDKLTLVCDAIPQGHRADPLLEEPSEPVPGYKRYQVNEQPSYLFTLNGSFHPGRRHFTPSLESISDFVPLLLTLSEKAPPLLPLRGSVLLINPYSTQKEEALHFLSYYLEHFPPAEGAAFSLDASPLESKKYKDLKTILGGEIQGLELRAQAAEGAAKQDLEAELQRLQSQLQGAERIKWDITEQALDDYDRALAQSEAVWIDPTVYANSFSPTYRQYLSGALSGDEVAQAFFSIYQMVLKESRWE